MLPSQSKRAVSGKGLQKSGVDGEGSDNSVIQLVPTITKTAKHDDAATDNLNNSRDDEYDQNYIDRINETKKKSKVITRDNLVFGVKPNENNLNGFDEKLSIMDHQKTGRSFEQKSEKAKRRKDDRPLLEMIIISPNWMPYQIFKMVIIPLCIVSSFLYAYFAAFRYDVDGFCFPKATYDQLQSVTAKDGTVSKIPIYTIPPHCKIGPYPQYNQIDAQPYTDEDINLFDKIQFIIESLFLIDCLLEFILEYTDEQTNLPVRNISQISLRYVKGEFKFDLLPLIPFNFVWHFRYSRLFYIVKCIRLLETFEMLDTGKFMKQVKHIFERQLQQICQNPDLANDINLDQNKIMTIIMIGYIFKTLKLVVIIFQVSYFLGIFFYIYCDLTNDLQYVVDLSVQKDSSNNTISPDSDDYYSPNFIMAFMDSQSNFDRIIGITYFSFTSLSTVGFGDMHPRNDYERSLTAFILLFGVAIFSIVMGNFIDISDSFLKMNQEFDDGDNLSKFFGLIKQFNKGQSIKNDMKIRIEEFFDYRWRNDKNQSISTPEDIALVEQLPIEIQRKIYTDFLFMGFLQSFRHYFCIPNQNSRNQHSFYSWSNFEYQNFMIQVLRNLEPVHYNQGKFLFTELDDVNEVIFIEEGFYDIGYEINKQIHLKMRFPGKTVIGGFEACFDKRCLFIYKTYIACKGYIVRKQNWRKLEADHPELYASIKRQALFNYIHKIRRPLLEQKHADIEHYDLRADYSQVLCLRNYNEQEMQEIVDTEVARDISHKDSEEISAMKEMEKRLCSYERYLTKIIKNYENSQEYTEEASKAQENLKTENERLRKLAVEQGLDLEEILKTKAEVQTEQNIKKAKKKVKGKKMVLSKAFYELQSQIKSTTKK